MRRAGLILAALITVPGAVHAQAQRAPYPVDFRVSPQNAVVIKRVPVVTEPVEIPSPAGPGAAKKVSWTSAVDPPVPPRHSAAITPPVPSSEPRNPSQSAPSALPAVTKLPLVPEERRLAATFGGSLTSDPVAPAGPAAVPRECQDAPAIHRRLHRGLWAQADYLLWWMEGYSVPPLVTSSTDPADAGVLGRPTTSVLIGDERLDTDARSGARLRFGNWCDCCETVGWEVTLFGLWHDESRGVSCDESGDIVARPFFNVDPGVDAQDAELVCFPDQLAGSVNVNTSSEVYSGAASLRKLLCRCANASKTCGYRVDMLAGYRYFNVDEGLEITESLTIVEDPDGLIIPGTTIDLFDRFDTDNEFHGGEIGLVGEMYRGCWKLEVLAKIALGNNHEVVEIDGGTTVDVPDDGTATRTGGLLAQPSNIGRQSEDHFAVIPEIDVRLSYQMTKCWRASLGYTFLYLSHAVRPGDQIDFNVDGEFLDPLTPPPADPVGPLARFVTDDV